MSVGSLFLNLSLQVFDPAVALLQLAVELAGVPLVFLLQGSQMFLKVRLRLLQGLDGVAERRVLLL